MWEKSYNPVSIHEWVPSGWASQVALVVKNLPANAGDVEMCVQSLGQEDPLEEGTATHSNILAWRAQGQRNLMGYSP